MLLTWKDLGVWIPEYGERRAILEGVTGYAEPREVLAIMGPSGCGKSTLLDALAGRLSLNARQTGEILVYGRKQPLAYGTSKNQSYVTQEDIVMNTLTVQESVHFSAQLRLPSSMTNSEKAERADEVIREMGLQDTMHTRIGGWNVKGISGGQKRRLSICIKILTRPKLLFLDEPTSGLDIAASFHVTNRLVNLAHKEKMTVIASIHQPSSEVFELFHSLCLLAYGKLVFFGPSSSATQLFALSGFPCPSLRNPSDHYLRIINNDFDQDVELGFREGVCTSTKEAVEILIKSYKDSLIYKNVENRLSTICLQEGDAMLKKREKKASSISQSIVLTKRSFVNMYRDLGYYWLRLAIYIALCLCVGTIFHSIGHSYGSIQARGSMLTFVAAFLTFMAIGGFPSFVEDFKEFFRLLAIWLLPCFLLKVAKEIIRVVYIPSESQLEAAITLFALLVSWTYSATIYFTGSVLFNLVCNLQVVHFENYGKLLERDLDVSVYIEEHMRLTYYLSKISHRFRIFLILEFLVVTASECMALLETTANHGIINFVNGADFAVSSIVQVVGIIICLQAATKISHRAQGLASVASRWNALVTSNSYDASQLAAATNCVNSNGVDPAVRIPISYSDSDIESDCIIHGPTNVQLASYMSTYHKRQALVMYIQSNPGGVTIFGWRIDRALMTTIFFIELSLVTFVLGKTISLSTK